jgi:predicted dehydrogenase
VRVGVIGTGFGRRVVAPAFDATAGCTVAEVVSARDADAVADLCRRDDIDLVAVHSPPFLHARYVHAAVAAGHAVLCDKPFGGDAREAAAMLDAALVAGVVNLVNFEFRHDPGRRYLHGLLRDGAIGRVEHVSWVHLSAGSRVPLRPFGWLFEAAKGGGWIGAWGSHAVDAVRWLVDEIAEASAVRRLDITARPDADGRLHPVDVEDGLTAWLRTARGTTVTLDSTFAATASVPARIVVTGTAGVVESIGDTRTVVRRADGEHVEHERDPGDSDRHQESMRRWAEVVRDVVGGDRPASGPDVATFADGLACARVLDELRTGPLVSREVTAPAAPPA